MNWTAYRAGRLATRFILFCTMRIRFLRRELADMPGPYLLATSHQGHLDPFIASTLQSRPIVWMTRREFYKYRWSQYLLSNLNAFSVHRQGIPVSAIRHAIGAARAGHVVGICPEGGVTCADQACFRGGRIKRGIASVAIRAQVPILPCLILGTARLHQVGPWLPAKHGRLWIAYGPPIQPPPGPSTRAARDALARQIEAAYVELYQELVETFDVDQRWVA